MAIADCRSAIRDILGRDLTDTEFERIAADVQARMKEKVNDGMTARDAARTVTKDVTDEAKLKKAQAQFVAYKNIFIYADYNLRKIEGNEMATQKSLLSGIGTKSTRNAATGVSPLHDMLRDQLLSPLIRDLRREKLLKLALSGDRDFDLLVARELKRRDDPTAGAATGDARAVKVAELFGRVLDTGRAMLNKEGAFIGKVDGYMGRQYHDLWKVRGDGTDAAYQKWKTAIMADRDTARDFAGMEPAEIESTTRAQWKALSTGVFDSAGNRTAGEYSVANKASQQRSITFKSAEGWFKYNEQFGKGSVKDAIFAGADHAARDTAVMRILGPTPKGMWDRITADLMRDAEQRNDMTSFNKIKTEKNQSLFEMVSGIKEMPGDMILAKRFSELRSLQQIIHLGGIMGSAISHIPINASMLRHNGVPYLTALAGQVRGLADAFHLSESRADRLSMLHVGLDGMFGHIIRRFHTEDGPPGQLAGAVNLFHKLNGFSYFMDAQKGAAGNMLSHSLALNAGKEFEQLQGRMQASLRRYGIEKGEWDQIRQTPQLASDGRQYIVPEHVADPKLADKLQTYISDQVREGANEPTPWARNIAGLRTQSGTLSGEIARTLTQFKSFAITMAERQWGREISRNGLDVPGAFLLAGGMTAFGFIGNQLRGLIANQRQTMPQDAAGWGKMITQSMVNGGALGLFADAFLRDGVRGGGDELKSLLGPTSTVVADSFGAISNILEGPQKAGGRTTRGSEAIDALHTIGGDVAPNWWMLRAAYNYAIPYSIANLIHPGAVQKHSQVLRQNNEAWILPPQ